MSREFLVSRLQRQLGFDDVHSLAEYCDSFANSEFDELRTYLLGLLDDESVVEDIVTGLIEIRHPRKHIDPNQQISSPFQKQSSKPKNKSKKQAESLKEASIQKPKPVVSDSRPATSNEFYSPGILPLPGPTSSQCCQCMGNRHTPLNNCTSCGFILCIQSSSQSSCPICSSTLLPAHVSLSQAVANKYPSSSFRAYEMKDLLLKYDISTEVNLVHDASAVDGNYSSWMSKQEVEELERPRDDDDEDDVSLSSRLDLTRLDYAGRRVK